VNLSIEELKSLDIDKILKKYGVGFDELFKVSIRIAVWDFANRRRFCCVYRGCAGIAEKCI